MKTLLLRMVAAAFVAGTLLAQTDSKASPLTTMPTQPLRTGYAPVNGLKIYFEIHGERRTGVPPLVLLHGGGDTIETSFGVILPPLARDRQGIAFGQRGFGHPADVGGRPFGFEDSADDTAALLGYLHVARVDIFGFSNGGSIALQVAMRYPGLVRRVIACTAIMKRAWVPAPFWDMMNAAQPDS